ncbi:MAG: hypothetical protein WB820_00030, partial [Rhodoplanes sp.]
MDRRVKPGGDDLSPPSPGYLFVIAGRADRRVTRQSMRAKPPRPDDLDQFSEQPAQPSRSSYVAPQLGSLRFGSTLSALLHKSNRSRV